MQQSTTERGKATSVTGDDHELDRELTCCRGASRAGEQGRHAEQRAIIRVPRSTGSPKPECREDGGGGDQAKEAMAAAARRSSSGSGHGMHHRTSGRQVVGRLGDGEWREHKLNGPSHSSYPVIYIAWGRLISREPCALAVAWSFFLGCPAPLRTAIRGRDELRGLH